MDPFSLGLYTSLVCEGAHRSLEAGVQRAEGVVTGIPGNPERPARKGNRQKSKVLFIIKINIAIISYNQDGQIQPGTC